jgi:hypothetical protein
MTTNEKKLLDLSKRLFFHFTGQTLEIAKELIAIEEELMIGETPKEQIKEKVLPNAKTEPIATKSTVVEQPVTEDEPPF